MKTIQYRENTLDNLSKFKNKLDTWHSKYSLFFTHPTARIESILRDFLYVCLAQGILPEPRTEEWNTIFELISTLILSLRAEIGNIDTKPLGQVIEINVERREYIRHRIGEWQKNKRIA